MENIKLYQLPAYAACVSLIITAVSSALEFPSITEQTAIVTYFLIAGTILSYFIVECK